MFILLLSLFACFLLFNKFEKSNFKELKNTYDICNTFKSIKIIDELKKIVKEYFPSFFRFYKIIYYQKTFCKNLIKLIFCKNNIKLLASNIYLTNYVFSSNLTKS